MSTEKAIALYTSLSSMLDTLEILFKERKFKELNQQYLHFRQEQKLAMHLDEKILHQLQNTKKTDSALEMTETRNIYMLLTLMQEIQDKYRNLREKMKLFMAIQKDEISRLNQGTQLLQKYQNGTSKKTGRRISRSC